MSPIVTDLVAIARFFGAFEREAVCCGTVTQAQCVVLQFLLAEPQDLSAVAEFTGSSKSATTRLVDGLERKGWTTRRRDDEDRRRVFVALTDAGRAEAERLGRMTEGALGMVLAQLPVERREQVAEVLSDVRGAMERARAAGDISCC